MRNFKLPQLVIFRNLFLFLFFFGLLACRRWFCLSFLLLFGISSRTTHRFGRPWSRRGKINKQRRCARKSAELVLVAFFAAIPLWKGVSVCTWYKKTFLGGFFLVGSTFSGYVRHAPSANRIYRQRYTKVRFSRKNPPFYLKHVLKLRPCLAEIRSGAGVQKYSWVENSFLYSYTEALLQKKKPRNQKQCPFAPEIPHQSLQSWQLVNFAVVALGLAVDEPHIFNIMICFALPRDSVKNNMTHVALRGRGTTSAFNCFPAAGLFFKFKVLC